MQPLPSREPGMRIAPLPISHKSPTVAPTMAAMTEDRALTHPDRMGGRADHHTVLQYRRVVADAHRSAVRPHHQPLRQNRAGTDADLTEDHRRTGNLRPRLVNKKLVETHAGLTLLLAVRALRLMS
jgi:hypothetical protein